MNRLSRVQVESLNPILHRGQSERTARRWSVERVAAGALPLLTSITALQPAANVLSSAFIGRAKVLNLREALQNQGRGAVLKRAADLACFIGVLSLTLISRRLGGALSLWVQAFQAMVQLLQALWSLDRVQIQAALLPVLSASIQLAALISGGALLWVVASGLMQVGGDLASAWQEGRSGGLYEASLLLLASLLRAISIAGPCRELVEDLTSKRATAADIQEILDCVKKEMAERLTTQSEQGSMPANLGAGSSTPPLALRIDEHLRQKGFSCHLKGLNLSFCDLQEVSLEGICFERCDLAGVQFDRSQLRRLEFRQCNLRRVSFEEAQIQQVQFTHSDLAQTSFERSKMSWTAFRTNRLVGANFGQAQMERVVLADNQMQMCNWGQSRLHQVKIQKSDLTESNFSQAQMDRVEVESCDLSNSLLNHARLNRVVLQATQLDQSCMLETEIQEGSLKNCRGQDTLFCGTEAQWKQHGCQFERSDRPIVALGWNPESPLNFGSLCYQSLKEQGAVVLRYDFRGAHVQPDQLAREVAQGLAQWDQGNANSAAMSRGQFLVQQPPGLATAQLVNQASRVLAYSEALLMPGGMDIEPELYGQQRTEQTTTEQSWNRSILEMALMEAARQNHAPVLGICRGMQMVHVFHGGTLHQHARPFYGQLHETHLCPSDSIGLESSNAVLPLESVGLTSPSFYAYSCHHQAVDELSPHCRPVAYGEGLIKAMMSRDGQYFGTQFHPEIYQQVDTDSLFKVQQFVASSQFDRDAALELHDAWGRSLPDLSKVPKDEQLEALRASLLNATEEYLDSVRIWRAIFSCHLERAIAARRLRTARSFQGPQADERTEALSASA